MIDITFSCPSCKGIIKANKKNYKIGFVICKCGFELPIFHLLIQPCGHPISAIVHTDEGKPFCGLCADDSLRENISKGIEA